MIVTANYQSQIGEFLIATKNEKLVGLWLKEQKYYMNNIKEEVVVGSNKMIVKTKNWLDRYFNNEKPDINELELDIRGSEFQKKVWQILKDIPYGEVMSYKEVAIKFAKQNGLKKMSAQAVGGAVARNPILIVIPCHRVVGSKGALTGYAAGILNKAWLLEHEKS